MVLFNFYVFSWIEINSQCYKSQVDTNYLIVLCVAYIFWGDILILPYSDFIESICSNPVYSVQTFSLLIKWCLIFSSRLLLGPELGLTGKREGEGEKLIVIWRRTLLVGL